MPMLAELVRATGHSAHLSVLDGLHILVIAAIESPNALRVIMRIGDQQGNRFEGFRQATATHSISRRVDALTLPKIPRAA